MTTASPEEFTQPLHAWSEGDERALARLTPLVFDDLHRLARRYMSGERPGHTLQTTALVNGHRRCEREPVWATNGREIFYRSGECMMSVAVTLEPEFRLSAPVVLFEGQFQIDPFARDARNYDVSPEGAGFVMVEAPDEDSATGQPLNIVLNWIDELERLAREN